MTTQPVHILLIDDDDVDIMAIKRAFRESKIGNPLLVAHDGIEALEMLRGQGVPAVPKPYIILLDLNMPRMNGVEFLTEIRNDPEHSRATIFVLTTSSAEEDKLAAYRKCIAGYIVKSNVGLDFIRLVKMLDAYWMVVEIP